jgi:hypothetical protein
LLSFHKRTAAISSALTPRAGRDSAAVAAAAPAAAGLTAAVRAQVLLLLAVEIPET